MALDRRRNKKELLAKLLKPDCRGSLAKTFPFIFSHCEEGQRSNLALSGNFPRASKDRRYDGRGYTIIELLITMAIIAIVGLIAVPSFQRIAINSNLKTAVRDIASDFALYKERAIAENRMYRIVLTVASGTYDIQQCGATGSVCVGGYNSIQLKNLTQYASDIIFNSGVTTVTTYFFQTRGTVTNGTIGLGNSRNSTGTITINITGRTNVRFILQ